MATIILVNVGSGNGLLPDSTKPLPGPVLNTIIKAQWNSPESHFTASAQDIFLQNYFENYNLRIIATSPRGHWVNTNKAMLAFIGKYIHQELMI